MTVDALSLVSLAGSLLPPPALVPLLPLPMNVATTTAAMGLLECEESAALAEAEMANAALISVSVVSALLPPLTQRRRVAASVANTIMPRLARMLIGMSEPSPSMLSVSFVTLNCTCVRHPVTFRSAIRAPAAASGGRRREPHIPHFVRRHTQRESISA